MEAPTDQLEIKCYLCGKELFRLDYAHSKFSALCEKCLNGLAKQEADQVKRLNREIDKMKESKHFKHSSEL